MPDPQKILATIRKAAELMRSTPGRSGSVIALDDADEVMVVGDLHGNLPAFRQTLAIAALDRHPQRHLVLQELVHEINKNDHDRPDRSHRLVDLVSALKCQYPQRVHLILGNHELSELTGRIIGKDGHALYLRFRRGMELAYGARTQDVYEAYLVLFADLLADVMPGTPHRAPDLLAEHEKPAFQLLKEQPQTDLAVTSIQPAQTTADGGFRSRVRLVNKGGYAHLVHMRFTWPQAGPAPYLAELSDNDFEMLPNETREIDLAWRTSDEKTTAGTLIVNAANAPEVRLAF